MANQLHTNPWSLDTASTSTILHQGPARIRSLVWSGYQNPTDRCVIKDGRTMSDSTGPTTVFDLIGKVDLSPIEVASGEGAWIYDFVLYLLDSGIVTVLLK